MKKEKKVKFAPANSNSGNTTVEKRSKSSDSKFSKENIVVAVRVRPLNNRELEFSNIETLKITEREIVTVLDPIEYKGTEEVSKNRSREQQFQFDYAFNKSTPQEEVYENTAKFLLPSVIDGFNATVFAYGATGAGKTFTMVGNGDNPGVMVRSLSDLFDLLEKQMDKNYKAKLSYVEVYNETLRDLLRDSDESGEVDMREDPHKGMVLVGLNEIMVNNAAEVFKILM
jgi:kinesin family member 18/19